MVYQSGGLIIVGIGKEESAAGTEASAVQGIAVESFSWNEEVAKEKKSVAQGQIEKQGGQEVMMKQCAPTIEMMCEAESLPFFLTALLGEVTPSTDDPEAGANTHTIDIKNDNQPQTYTIVAQEISGVKKAALYCMCSEVRIESTSDGRVRVKATFRGKFPVTSTLSISFATPTEFVPKNSTAKQAVNVAGLGAADDIDFESFAMILTRTVEPIPALGFDEPVAFMAGAIEAKGEVSLAFEDNTYRDQWSDNDSVALQLNLVSTNVIGATATKASLVLTLWKCKLDPFGKEYPIDGKLMQTFTYEVEKVLAADMIQAIVINNNAGTLY